MKYYILLISSLFVVNTLFSQELIVDSGVALKRGVYRTFDEFKYNNPSLDYDGPLEYRYASYSIINTTDKIEYVGIGKKIVGKVKSKTVYGFSDGKKVYLNLIGLSPTSKNFVELEYLGRYCYYKFVSRKPGMIFMFGLMGMAISTTKGEVLIDINNGEYYEANKSRLEKLFPNVNIQEDLELTKGSAFKYKELVEKYSLLNEDEIIRQPFLEEEIFEKLLNRLPADTSIDAYQARVSSLTSDSRIFKIRLVNKAFKNGQPKMFGIWAKHDMGNNSDYFYDIGTWYHFHENGQLKEEVNYNLLGEKNGRNIKYDDQGKVINELIYVDGVLVQ